MILYLQEGQIYSEYELVDKLKGVEIINVNAFIELALFWKALIPINEKSGVVRRIEATPEKFFKVKYVGILKFESTFIISYPKYIKSIQSDINDSNKKFKEIIRVIEKYYSSQIYNENYEKHIESTYFDLKVKIIRNYITNGIYKNDLLALEYNGEDEIMWPETILNFSPYIIHKAPIYLDYFTSSKRDDVENLVRKIHESIIMEIQDEFSIISNLLGYEPFVVETNRLNNFENTDYLIRVLENELRIQNVTMKQDLLKDLINYLKVFKEKSSLNTIEIYGTTSFNLVWEDICKKIYKDHLNYRLDELNLTLSGFITNFNKKIFVDYSKRELLKDVIDKPIWVDIQSGTKVIANFGAILDVLHINHTNKSFDIYDAKYYCINFKNDQITGQPGIEDITKQYFYQRAFDNLAKLNDYTFNNYFIVPIDDLTEDTGDGVQLYMASIPYISELSLKDITVIGRDCSTFYKAYLK